MELSKKIQLIRIRHSLRRRRFDGGEGSGNWGHAGRPGEVGGSAEGGGEHNRQISKEGHFTSFSKKRRDSAKTHGLTMDDIKTAKADANVKILYGGKLYQSFQEGNYFKCSEDGSMLHIDDFKNNIGKDVRVFIPNSMNPNFKFTKDDKAAMAINQQKMGKAFNPDTKKKADDKYRAQAGRVWNELDEDTKSDLYSYTQTAYTYMNDSLRSGNVKTPEINEKIDRVTKALDKSEFQEDVVLRRGINRQAAEKMFGLPKGYLSPDNHTSESNISMVGRVGTDDAFVSTGASEGTGFNSNVSMEIYVPKGTKGMYVEPFSSHGLGDKRSWDGKSKQKYFSSECEIILQRGCTFQVIGHEIATDEYGGKYHKLKVALIRQDPEESKYSKKRAKTS